jgi:hypothetical protein
MYVDQLTFVYGAGTVETPSWEERVQVSSPVPVSHVKELGAVLAIFLG